MRITADKHEMERQLFAAAARGDCGVLRMLAMAGVDLEARNEEGFTALNIAAMNNRSEAMTTLLAARTFMFERAMGNITEPPIAGNPAKKKRSGPQRKVSGF